METLGKVLSFIWAAYVGLVLGLGVNELRAEEYLLAGGNFLLASWGIYQIKEIRKDLGYGLFRRGRRDSGDTGASDSISTYARAIQTTGGTGTGATASITPTQAAIYARYASRWGPGNYQITSQPRRVGRSQALASHQAYMRKRYGAIYPEHALERKPLPVRQQVDPFIGWKAANLNNNMDGFVGVGVHKEYKTEDVAICGEIEPTLHNSGESGVIPSVDCGCGFYAWNDWKKVFEAGSGYNSDLYLRVELYGRVIKHSLGYRAEKQRVLGVYLRRCSCPANFDAIGYGEVTSRSLQYEHKARITQAFAMGVISKDTYDAYMLAVAPGGSHKAKQLVCKSCSQESFVDKFYSLSDLSNLLGTEVQSLSALESYAHD